MTGQLFTSDISVYYRNIERDTLLVNGITLTQELIAKITGAVDNSIIDIKLNCENRLIYFTTNNSDYYEGKMIRIISRDPSGAYTLENAFQYLRPFHYNKGIGTLAFQRQVAACFTLGISQIIAESARDDSSDHYANGYYTLPRWGFDGDIPPSVIEKIGADWQVPEEWKIFTKISQLISTTKGLAWWRVHGEGTSLSFQVSKDSPCMKVFHAYLSSKNQQLYGD